MNLLIALVSVLFFGGALYAVYFMLLRPSLLFWTRRRAVAVRDDLRLAVMTGEIGQHEKSVGPTAGKLDALINGCEHVGIVTAFFVTMSDSSIRFEAERDAQTAKEAGAAMKDIIRRADMLIVASVVINSPFFWFILPPLYTLGALTGKISRWVNALSLIGKHNSGHDHHGGLAPA